LYLKKLKAFAGSCPLITTSANGHNHGQARRDAAHTYTHTHTHTLIHTYERMVFPNGRKEEDEDEDEDEVEEEIIRIIR
jgi:hypothetical protein